MIMFPSVTGQPCKPSTTEGQICTVSRAAVHGRSKLTRENQALGATLTTAPPPAPTFTLRCMTGTKYNAEDGGDMSLEDATDAINKFCDKAKSKGVVTHWNPDAGTSEKFVDYGKGKSVGLSVNYDLSSGHPSDCYKQGPFDFSTDEVYKNCKANLGHALNNCTSLTAPFTPSPLSWEAYPALAHED